MKVRHRSIGNYSGPVVEGAVLHSVPTGVKKSFCIYRAHWLTSKVETGAKFGAIMMADGTAVTAGLDQFVLVYPKKTQKEDFNAVDDQGVLGKLLRRIELIGNAELQEGCVIPLWGAFEREGIYVAQDGLIRYARDCSKTVGNKLVDVSAGDIVHGVVLQDTLTPFKGVVSGPEWPIARRWAELFHSLFKHEATYKVQQEFGVERMMKNVRRRKLSTGESAEEFFFGGKDITAVGIQDVDWPVDLAFAVWYSNSVNAPGTAMRILRRFKRMDDAAAVRLIRALATSQYGRWHWTIRYGRYQRTRSAARASGLWPKKFFDGKNAIMPAKF